MTEPKILIILFFVLFIFFGCGLFVFTSMINVIFFHRTFLRTTLVTFGITTIYLSLFLISFSYGEGIFLPVYRVLTYYRGILWYAFLLGLIFWMFYGIAKIFSKENLISRRYIGYGVVFILICITGLSIYNFHKGITVKEITLYSDKIEDEHKFIQIGDIQLGSVSKHHLQKTIELAIQQDPDFIVFVGDLVDGNYYRFDDLEVFNDLPIPLYFISGNHEYYHDYDRV